jgi:YesN/AraC family two-component response regulator
LVKFERLLDNYFNSEMPQTIGLPTVKYCAENIHLSANYLGDLIKKETGKSPQEHIELKLMDIAKERIFDIGFKHNGSRSNPFINPIIREVL